MVAYPNPCADGTHIQTPEKGKLSVYNAYGQLLFSQAVEVGTFWESTSWVPGPYYLHLETETGHYSQRLLVLNQR